MCHSHVTTTTMDPLSLSDQQSNKQIWLDAMDACWRYPNIETGSTCSAEDQERWQTTEKSGSEEARRRQVDVLGSEAILTRVEDKMADLKVDLLFYWDQVKLMEWRNRVLNRVLLPHWRTSLEKGFLATYGFNQILQDDLLIGTDFTMARSIDHLFCSPWRVVQLLRTQHYLDQGQQCRCDQCQDSLAILRRLLTNKPGVVVLTRLVIHSNPDYRAGPSSLREASMRRVEELGLGLDCLPVTVRRTMRGWPEEGVLKERPQRMLQLLDSLVFEEMTFAILEEVPQLQERIEDPKIQNCVVKRIKFNLDLVKQRILEEGQREGRRPNPSSYLPTLKNHPLLSIVDDEIIFRHIEEGKQRSYIDILGLDSNET